MYLEPAPTTDELLARLDARELIAALGVSPASADRERYLHWDKLRRLRFIVNSLMEEAIRSSQLEGATTPRVVAKELLRSGRGPRDHSERMIVNNYRTIQYVKEMGNEPRPAGPPGRGRPHHFEPSADLPDRLKESGR